MRTETIIFLLLGVIVTATLLIPSYAQTEGTYFIATYRVVEIKYAAPAHPYARVMVTDVPYILSQGQARVSPDAAASDTFNKLLLAITSQDLSRLGEAPTRSVVVSVNPVEMGSCLPEILVFGSDMYMAKIYSCSGLVVRGEISYYDQALYTFNLVTISNVPATAIEGVEPFPNPLVRIGLILASILITVEAYRAVKSFKLEEILGGDLVRYVYEHNEEAI